MIFRQVTNDDLGCASYLIGDEKAGVAAVVDPRFEIDEYLELARYMDVAIYHVLETHNHADHVSGHGRLVYATGATIHIHRLAEPDYEHDPFDHGWELELGTLTVRALHTPGHRPEHTAFALIDTDRADEPWAVLTGDTLFVGDVARPDLAVDKHEGARGMFQSLHDKLLTLPDSCEVWPGHVGGSMCGGPGMNPKTSSTIGFERTHNELLAVDEQTFVEWAIARLGPQPPRFQAIVELNRGALITDWPELPPLTPRQVEQTRIDGALVVDVRTDYQFDEAHIPGALCIPMHSAGFGSKLAWIAGRDQPVLFVGRDQRDGRRAATLALSAGVSKLAGFLEGGMTAWRQESRSIERIERVAVERLPARMHAAGDLQVLDVRERSAWESEHIPGSIHADYHDVAELPRGLDPDRPIAVICESGKRAAVAASLVQRLGGTEVIHVTDGGVNRWRELGHPIIQRH